MGLSEDTQEPVASLNIRHGDEDSVRVVPASQVSDLTHAMHIFVAKNEMNKGVSSDFDTFYGTTQIVKELLGVYSELRALGHPGYQRVSVQMNRVGAFEEDLYVNALEEARGERVSWKKRLTEYKERERRLLFLSNMQILQCGSAIRNIIKEAHEARAKENTDAVFRSLYPYAWACFPEKAFSISSAQVFTAYRAASRTFSTGIGASDEPSAEKHLESVFTFVSTMRTTLRDDRFHGGNSAPEEGEGEGGDGEDGESDRKVRVVQALGFTPCALLHVLIEVFGDRAPHPSRTLYCDRGTSAAEVARFLACVEAFPALSYAAVGVNDLSVEPREALLEWTAQALRPKRRSDESENENENEPRESKRGALTLIFTGRESLELFGFVPCKREEDELRCEDYTTYEGSGVDFKRATKRLGIETLAVYTGRPQTGKTYAIRKRILNSKVSTRYLGITVSEDFTPAKFIRRYVRAAAAGEQQEQHIVVKVSPYGRVAAFGRFLCDALLWGVLADKGTGEMLCLCGPEAMNSYIQESQRKGALQLYVEVEEAPAEDGETPYTSEESVLSALPGLTAFCTERNRISENAKLYTFGFLTVKEYEKYSFAALCYCEYHNGGSAGSMRSGTTALRALMSRDRATTDELKQFRAHLQTLTPSIAVEKRLARLYCARYQWLKDHLTFLGSAGALDGAASSLVSPAVYCEIIEAEVAQLSGKTLSGFTQHLNIYSESSGTYVDFSKDGKTLAELGRRKGRGALPQVITLAEAMKEPSVLRSALSSGFSDKSVFDILLAQGYVLTPDFVLKLLMLNDFARARQNVVLSGDTGSGKTELLTVFSKLVNLHQSIVPALLTDLGAALKGVPGVGRMSALGKKGHYTEEGLFEAALLLSEAVQFSYISSTPKGRTDILATLARFVAKYADVIEETDAMRLVAESARNATASAVMCQEVQDAVRDVVLEIVQPRFKGTFVKILMHQGVTADAFRREVAGVRTTAARLAQITDRATVVAFIDECTSTTVMSLVKEVIADHTLDGAPLPGNIMWIGAFNRNELRKSGDNSTENGNGNRSNIREDFAVRPPPIAFEYSEIVFNAMEDREQQETFVKNLILMRLEQGAFSGFFDEKKKEQKEIWNKELITLCSAVLYCHYYIGKKHDEQRKKALTSAGEGEEEEDADAVLRRIHMSLRDIVQCVDLYLYFHRHSAFFVRDAAMSNGGIEQRRLWMHYNSVLLATAVVYYYRMPSAYRKEFEDGLSPRSLGGPRKAYGAFVQEATRQLYADTEIPNGVAPTAALLENLFCTVVCIDAGLPLIIVGPPGCSKTLSFKIAVDNMKGEQSAHATYRGLGHAHPFRYQCSPASTDAEIAGVFQSAIAEQRMHDSGPNKGRQRCVVLLDEAGLPDERRSPLKVLHYVLDHPQVAAVLLSNTPLDAAKTSRMVMVVQERPGPADLRELAWGSICGCDAAGNVRREATLGAIPVAEGERIKCAIEGLCAAYEELTEACRDGDGARKKTTNGRAWKTYAPAPNYFHLRDFVYMLRYIGREHRKMESFYGFTPAIVARALRRNFGGAASEAQFEAVLGVFFGNLRQKLRRYDGPGLNGIDWECKRGAARRLHATTLDALRECIIDEKVADGEDPNVAPFRNALILDPTESEASVHLLFSLGLCSPENAVIVHVSDFEQDATEEARSSAVVQVKDAMAEGKTVVLLNAMAISTSFYDVFNKNFDMVPVNSAQHGTSESEERSVKMHDGDLTELYKRYRYFANVAVGSYSRPCSVHPDFRVIAHVPISELPRIPAAFLSRFEKYCLSLESALDAVVPGLTPAQQETLLLMHSDCEKMIAAASPDAFYGLVPRETLFSLCLQAAIRMKEQESEEVDKEEGAETALRAMLPFHVSDKMAAEDCAGRDGRFRAARAVNFRLLQLGRPEGVLGCSDFFPEPYLREYVVRQEHFSIVRLLRHLFAPSNAEKRPQKLCLFTRTCAELVHLYSDRALQTFVSSMASGDSRTPGSGDGNATSMTFVSLAQFPSSRACEDCVVRFKDSADVALVCVADVRECTNDQINFFRKKVDSHISHAGNSKAVVLILHYPPEMQALRASRAGCSAIFLNGWDFAYVDSFGCNSTNDSSNVDSESSYDLSALEVSEAAKEGDEGDEGGRVELLLNPRTWLVRAFNLDVECSEDDVRALFARMFAEKVHGQICHIQRSITQGRKPRLPLSSKFYWGSAKNGSGRPNTRNMMRFLDGVLSSQSYIVDAVLTKFTAMWCGDLLRALILEACRQISQGRILSGLLSVFQASMSTLLDPVVAMLLRAMCSNYALEPIARITLEGRDPDEAAAERAFVERILCNIGVPPKDVLVSLSLPSAGSGAGAGALTAKIHCLWPFPPYLPMFEVVMNRVNELAAFIKTDTRDRPRHFATLADELAMRIRSDWIGKAAKILAASPHLLTLLKRDIVVFESRLYKVHAPQEALDKDPAAGVLLDLCTSALEALTEGHKDSLAHLFLAADMKRQRLAFFVEAIAKLQHIYPPLDVRALLGVFDFGALERDDPAAIENAVLRVGVEGMWNTLRSIGEGIPGTADEDDLEAMLVSFEKTYRLLLAQMPPRNDLYTGDCINTKDLAFKADVVRIAELFLLNVSPFKNEALPHIRTMFSRLNPDRAGPLALSEAVEIALAMSEGKPEESVALFVRDVIHEFTEATKVPEGIPVAARRDLSYFFGLISEEGYARMLPPVWAVNFLYLWIKNKPTSWKSAILSDLFKLLPNNDYESIDLLKTDLTFFSPQDFVYYHICVQVLNEGTISDLVQFASQAGEAPTIRAAACTAAITKRIAATITNSGGNAVLDFSRPLVAFFNRHKAADSRVKNVDSFLITSIESETKCLGFLQNKSALTFLGMEEHFITATSTARMSYPLFTLIPTHPLHNEYAFFVKGLKSGDKEGFISSLGKKIEGERANKPRLKRICKMMLLASMYYEFFDNNIPAPFDRAQLNSIARIIGITPEEANVYKLVSNGWLDVPNQELDSFLALFSTQFRSAKESDITICRK